MTRECTVKILSEIYPLEEAEGASFRRRPTRWK